MRDLEFWLKEEYPTTIVNDRYGGTYSHAAWLAFPIDFYSVPEEIDGEDGECMWFWDKYKEPVGRGATPNEAVADLRIQVMNYLQANEDGSIKKLQEVLNRLKEEAK